MPQRRQAFSNEREISLVPFFAHIVTRMFLEVNVTEMLVARICPMFDHVRFGSSKMCFFSGKCSICSDPNKQAFERAI
eukprot:6471302-Amphidinium_carterae.1